MKKYYKSIQQLIVVLLIWQAAYTVAHAQTATDPCRIEVAKFERAIGLIRQLQGVEAANKIKEKLLPAKLESEILFKDGYCGLAKHLREKKLI
jgi:hypothetical protein